MLLVDRAQMRFDTNMHVLLRWFGVEADRFDFRAVGLQVYNYLIGSGGSDVMTTNLG